MEIYIIYLTESLKLHHKDAQQGQDISPWTKWEFQQRNRKFKKYQKEKKDTRSVRQIAEVYNNSNEKFIRGVQKWTI